MSIDNLPPVVVVEINNTCNLNCSMCQTQSAKRPKGEMSLEMFNWLLETVLKIYGRNLILHAVGEPLFHSRFYEIIKLCHEHGKHVHLTTNGLLLKDNLDAFKDYPDVVRSMAFSIDGATKETYERIRKGGKFEALIESLELLLDINNKRENGKRIKAWLQAVISRDNQGDIDLFPVVYSRFFDPKDIKLVNLGSLYAPDSLDYYEKNRLHPYRLKAPCNLLWVQTHILWNGDVSVCCRDYNGELVVGNIFNSSIGDIWNNDLYTEYRAAHMFGDTTGIPLCNRCYIQVEE